MIQTTLVPQNTTVIITVPDNYVGKTVHALIYIDEEITEVITSPLSKKPSDFFGTLSLEEGEKMQSYTIEARKEWSKDI